MTDGKGDGGLGDSNRLYDVQQIADTAYSPACQDSFIIGGSKRHGRPHLPTYESRVRSYQPVLQEPGNIVCSKLQPVEKLPPMAF